MIVRAFALALVLSLASCGALRWAFAPGADGTSRADKTAQVIAANGSDPIKWISWLSGLGVFTVAGASYGVGRWHGRERRSGRDRRASSPAGTGLPPTST